MTPDQIAELRRQKYNATLLRLTKVHSDLFLLRVKPDFPIPAHKPGQYTVLGLGNWEPRRPECQQESLAPAEQLKVVRRSYSISCSVLDDRGNLLDLTRPEWLEFYIVLVRQSGKPQAPALTPRLFLLNQGDRLIMGDKITGLYTLEGVKPDDTVVFLSTGTGEAPHNYMLWELLRRKHPGRILAACCVRLRQDLAYLRLHQTLMTRHPNYTYLPLTTREGTGPGGKVYIQDLLSSGELERQMGKKLDPQRTHIFLCGNPKMIGVPEKDRETGKVAFPQPLGVIEILTQRGFQLDDHARKVRGSIHYEEYW